MVFPKRVMHTIRSLNINAECVSDGNASKLLITRCGRFVRRLNYGRPFVSGPRTKRFMYETVNVYSVGSLNYAIKASRKAESLRTIAQWCRFRSGFFSGTTVVWALVVRVTQTRAKKNASSGKTIRVQRVRDRVGHLITWWRPRVNTFAGHGQRASNVRHLFGKYWIPVVFFLFKLHPDCPSPIAGFEIVLDGSLFYQHSVCVSSWRIYRPYSTVNVSTDAVRSFGYLPKERSFNFDGLKTIHRSNRT